MDDDAADRIEKVPVELSFWQIQNGSIFSIQCFIQIDARC